MAKSQELEERYIIRPATKSDYEDVIDINRHVYHDYDYLPGKYLDYMDHWANFGVVAQDRRNDKLVAFDMATVVDDGETMVARAGRTQMDYQQQGLMSLVAPQLRAQLPYGLRRNMKHVAFTTTTLITAVYDNNVKRGTPLILQKAYLFVREENIGNVMQSFKDINSVYGENSGSNIRQLQPYEVVPLFTSSKLPSCFEPPQDRIIVTWVPYRRGGAMNARILQEMEDVRVFVTADKHEDYSCVSFGTRIPMPLLGDAIRLDLDVYASMKEGRLNPAIREHIKHQLHQAAIDYRGKQVHAVVTFPNPAAQHVTAKRQVIDWCSDFGMPLLKGWGPWQKSEQVLFERSWPGVKQSRL